MKKSFTILAIAVAAFSVISCSNSNKASHVILIGLDGMSSAEFIPEEMPTVKSLMDQGCWTLSKRSVLPSSSAINWASMFMGVGTELHGYTTWGSRTPELQSRVVNSHGICPTMFSLLDEQRPGSRIDCFYEWETVVCFIDSLAVDHYECAGVVDGHADSLCILAESCIKTHKPNLLAVIWDRPDHEGHLYGWGSPEYHAMVRELDGYIARVIQAYKDAGIYDDTVFIVTSDHGGVDKGHGNPTLDEMETPFIIAGKGIRNGGEIEESMMQYDVAATVTEIFGLERPQVWVGRPVMSVFE